MPRRHIGGLVTIAAMLAAAGLPGCSQHAQNVPSQAATPAPAASGYLPALATPAAPEALAAPMTREKASTDCWMRYEKEGRGLSLDQRLPLVEKCTAEKLKAAGR